jgi:hypothetical protein
MSGSSDSHRAVLAQAEAYGEAVYHARAEVFEEMCHENFQMTLVAPEGLTFWDKAAYLDRVRGRQAFAGAASYGIFSIDVSGDETARVHCWVDVPPLRYEDHLGFVKVDGRWMLLTKVFRTKARLDGQEEER